MRVDKLQIVSINSESSATHQLWEEDGYPLDMHQKTAHNSCVFFIGVIHAVKLVIDTIRLYVRHIPKVCL